MIETFNLPEEQQLQLALQLHEERLFGVHEYPDEFITLKSDRVSPHYLDIRPGISSSRTRGIVSRATVDLAGIGGRNHEASRNGFEFDHIAGTPEAFTSYAANMAYLSGVSLLQPRVGAKAIGNKTPILGRFNGGDSVAVFDDVITDGATKIETIEGLGEAGLNVVAYYVVMDRQEGGTAQVLEATGIAVQSALKVANVVAMMRAEDVYSDVQFNNVQQYLAEYGDPGAAESMDRFNA